MSVSSAPASVIVSGQIADAEFAAKARAGHADDIRLCLSCNQECVGRMGLNRWLGCIENPRQRSRHTQSHQQRIGRAGFPPDAEHNARVITENARRRWLNHE
jgi:hypothetical protein